MEGAHAVRPRHAATLILVRRDLGKPYILMGRRSGGHDFMPNKWVFPGGRVDRCDFTAPAATELRPEVEVELAATVQVRQAHILPRALAMAAVRETFEEAGLLLAKPRPSRSAVGGWRAFMEQGAAPDLAALELIARAITPSVVRKRFDARFFMADATALMSLERAGDTGELDRIDWFTLEEAAALDLPTITRLVIREIGARHQPARQKLGLSRQRQLHQSGEHGGGRRVQGANQFVAGNRGRREHRLDLISQPIRLSVQRRLIGLGRLEQVALGFADGWQVLQGADHVLRSFAQLRALADQVIGPLGAGIERGARHGEDFAPLFVGKAGGD